MSSKKAMKKTVDIKSDKDFTLNEIKMVTVSLFKNNVYIHLKDKRKHKFVTFNLSDFTTLLNQLPKIKKTVAPAYNFLHEKDKGKKSDSNSGFKEENKFPGDKKEKDDDEDEDEDNDMTWD